MRTITESESDPRSDGFRMPGEFEPQTRLEGELQQMPADFQVVELGQVLQGLERGRTDARREGKGHNYGSF